MDAWREGAEWRVTVRVVDGAEQVSQAMEDMGFTLVTTAPLPHEVIELQYIGTAVAGELDGALIPNHYGGGSIRLYHVPGTCLYCDHNRRREAHLQKHIGF